MLTDKKKDQIQERLKNTIPIETPGVWYHEDVPILLRALSITEKACPNGGNDGYITPRPCQCEVESIETDRDDWKARAEALEMVIIKNKPCWACKRKNSCDSFDENECYENGRRFWNFDKV